MCNGILISFLISLLFVTCFMMFSYRASYILLEHDFDSLNELLAGSEAELSNLIDENIQLQTLNQQYEFQAKVR